MPRGLHQRQKHGRLKTLIPNSKNGFHVHQSSTESNIVALAIGSFLIFLIGIYASFLFPNSTINALAQQNPREIPGLDKQQWKVETTRRKPVTTTKQTATTLERKEPPTITLQTMPQERIIESNQANLVQSFSGLPPPLEATKLLTFSSAHCQGNPVDEAQVPSFVIDPVELVATVFPKSVLLHGNGLAEVYVGAQYEYKGTVMAVEKCVDFYQLFEEEKQQRAKFMVYSEANQEKVLTEKRQVSQHVQEDFATTKDLSKPHVRFVFSATSSEYFSYQVYANALGFLQSNQTNASWLRLLSASIKDDLSEKFPTFTAPKSLYNIFYQPINKADVIDKWMHSRDAPNMDDTIVVIDTDNWLINDIHKWTTMVSPKQATGQRSYYSGSPMFQQLWKEICRANCNTPVDPVGVLYIIQASDLKDVAPLWRSYSIEIKQRFHDNTTFKEYYGPGLGVRWAAEMFGWNAACTHLSIKTNRVTDMQIRDVDGGKQDWERLGSTMPMIHVGRAWFPKEAGAQAAPWRHSLDNDPNSVAANGIEVWCKCNNTAVSVQPWPLPDGMDFVSFHTLRLLHDSVKHFGPIPVNEAFRRKKPVFYAWSHP